MFGDFVFWCVLVCVKGNCSSSVKDKIVELIGMWNHALGSDSQYRAIFDTHNIMKVEGQSWS